MLVEMGVEQRVENVLTVVLRAASDVSSVPIIHLWKAETREVIVSVSFTPLLPYMLMYCGI